MSPLAVKIRSFVLDLIKISTFVLQLTSKANKRMKQQAFDIVGGGIAGLSTALALSQKDLDFRLFEQAKSYQPIGAGLILANNALEVYQRLGIYEAIKAKSSSIRAMHICDEQLRPLSTIEISKLGTKLGSLALHRADLQDILLDQLDLNKIKMGHQLQSFKQEEKEIVLDFAHAGQYQATQVLAADGLYSKLRSFVTPHAKIRNSKQLCWRGLCQLTLPPEYQNQLFEAWGKARRFGFVPIGQGWLYYYALLSYEESPEELDQSQLLSYFQDFHPLIRQILLEEAKLHKDEIRDLSPIKSWHKGPVCLLGDAAHALTPNMGQGACQAIEDAYVVAHYLSSKSPEAAYAAYQANRQKKALKVVQNSWQIGQIAHWKAGWARSLRNGLMRLTPNSLSAKSSAHIFSFQAPL